MTDSHRIRTLINRLARLDATGIWAEDLNPAQIAAIDYLARANRFSRSPSHVADYLGTTRGTMSQTLKALDRKGYVREFRSAADKRSISYSLTAAGTEAAARSGSLTKAIDALPPSEKIRLAVGLSATLTAVLAANGGRSFGLCRDCAHHQISNKGVFCALLSLPLETEEAGQICHEQVPA